MVPGGIAFLVFGAVLIILGISFVVDIKKGVGPTLQGASVDSLRPHRTYTFMRIEGPAIAWFVTILTFILAAGAIVAGIVMLVL